MTAYAAGRGPSWPCACGHTSKTAGCIDCVDISGRTTGRSPAWACSDCGHTAVSESGGWHDCPPPTSIAVRLDPGPTTEYAILCRRDGKVRDISTLDPVKAAEWASSRDRECGCCYAEHNPHVVVSRQVTDWRVAASGDSEPTR